MERFALHRGTSVMTALQYRLSIPRYLLLRWLGPRFRSLYTSFLSPVQLCDIEEPRLPNDHWVRIKPILAGICGSDLAAICAKGSPYLGPVTSMPFVLGHEVVGTIAETGDSVDDLRVGRRVVLHPALGCRARGIDPPCNACTDDNDALCRNVTRGDIAAGIQTGYCRDTGGGFSRGFVAHRSQVYPVPDELEDRAAVLIEPFACALHGVLRTTIRENDAVLVIGCGAIGLLTIAALRATGCRARILAVARHEHQKQHALALGANELLTAVGSVQDRYTQWAGALEAEALEPQMGKPTIIGGADVTFDCVASSQSIDDALRFTKSGGAFVLVGMPGVPKDVDWTPLWYKELTVRAAYAYGPERIGDQNKRDTFDIAIELMRTWGAKLSALVGEPFALSDYRSAFAAALNTGRSRVVKTVFAVNTM